MRMASLYQFERGWSAAGKFGNGLFITSPCPMPQRRTGPRSKSLQASCQRSRCRKEQGILKNIVGIAWLILNKEILLIPNPLPYMASVGIRQDLLSKHSIVSRKNPKVSGARLIVGQLVGHYTIPNRLQSRPAREDPMRTTAVDSKDFRR